MRTSWHDPTVPIAGEATPAARDTASPVNPAQALGAALLFNILAGICGVLLTTAFDGSAEARLAGAVVGTVVASLFTVSGPFLHLRATAAIAITIIALIVTYGGGRAVGAAAGPNVEIFPPLPGNADGDPGGGTTSSPTSPPTSPPPVGETCEGALCIQVTPLTLVCASGPCDPVTVANTGRKELVIGEVEVTGAAADRFQPDAGCAGVHLQPKKPDEPKETCTIRLVYTGTGDGEAKLVIHQNLEGPASRITLSGRGTAPSDPPSPLPDLALSAAQLRCSVMRDGALSGADALSVDLAVLDVGAVPVSRLVPFSLRSETGLEGGGNSAISDGTAVTAMQVDLRPGDYGQTHALVARIDPNDEIAEADERNNGLTVTVSLGDRPEGSADVPCRVTA